MAKVKSTAQKVDQRIKTVEEVSYFINKYDFDNKYPQRVIDIVNDSGTAKTCLKLHQKFVFGGGLKDLDFYKAKVNSKQTADKFLRQLNANLFKFGGCAIHFNYNGLIEKKDVTIIPFEYCRLVPDNSKNAGKIAVYDDWGHTKRAKFNQSDIVYVDPYNPSKVQEQVDQLDNGWNDYKGQILYFTSDGQHYPLAPFDAVLEDMLTEAQCKKFKHSSATDNFLASHLLIVGESESEEDSQTFDENLRGFQGGDGAGRLLVLEKANNESPIELKKIEIQDYDGLYEYTENSSRDAIIKMFLIPPVLLLRVAGSLGTSKEISDAFDYYNGITSDDRLLVEELLKEIFNNFHFNICPSGDYSILPLKYSKPIDTEYTKFFSEDEIRISLGYEPREKPSI